MIGRGALALIVALVAAGCLAVLLEAQSESAIYFTGDRTQAVSQGGIIFYTVGGQQYTITDEHRGARDTTPVPVTVYVEVGDPVHARADGVVRWIDLVSVGVWFAAALAVFPLAVARQRRRRRRQQVFAAGGRGSSARW